MAEVEPGIPIHQLKLPIPNSSLGYVNAYLVEGDRDNGCLLVDTGWNTEEAFHSLKSQLAEIGFKPEDISQIVVTHVHPDHYGLAGRLKSLSSARLALHYLEKDFIDSRYINTDVLLQQMARWLKANGAPPGEVTELQTASLPMIRFVTPTLPDVTLKGGETITTGYFSFRVLWTPGHTAGHVCLYEPSKKILLSGDHILPTITPHIGLHPQSESNPLGDYLSSLNTLKELDIQLVLPGHENPFTGFKPRIEELIQHHQRRNAEILKTLKANPKTAYQIATEITWMGDSNGVGWDKLSSWDKRMAVLETLSHLEVMRAGKKVGKLLKDSTTYYQPSRGSKNAKEDSKTN